MQKKEKERDSRAKGDTAHMLSGCLETNDGRRKYRSEDLK